jgi:hypothetical protein
MRVKRTEMVSKQHIPKTRCHNSGIRSYLPQWVPLFEPERRALTNPFLRVGNYFDA